MKNLYRPLILPGITIPGNLFLAPMAGYTDRAFREICLLRGADLTFTEMISCEGLNRDNNKTFALLDRGEEERFWGIQIFGSDADCLKRAVEKVLPFEPTLLDLNCGCPVPKVTNTGAGASLMKDPGKIHRLVETLVRAVEESGTLVPVTAKIRSGWDDRDISYLEAGKAIEAAGASLVTLHPRTRSQVYSGKSNWKQIEELSRSLSIPVIGSGDLFSPDQALKMLDETGCAGIMFARGAFGNPSIFNSTKHLLWGDSDPGDPDNSIKLSDARRHLHLAVKYLGEKRACREMRKHFCAYTKGIPGSSKARNRIVQALTVKDYEEALEGLSITSSP